MFLPAANRGYTAVTEREVRRITTEIDWQRQREQFMELMASRAARNQPSPVQM